MINWLTLDDSWSLCKRHREENYIEKMVLRFTVTLTIFFSLFVSIVICSEEKDDVDSLTNVESVGRQLLEQGRSFVRHMFKRFSVLVPVIFFKLGVGFTLLVLVTLLAANNGLIGFLLLVVGMSAVLARFQEARRAPIAAPAFYAAPPHIPAHIHWDRKDTAETPQMQNMGPTLPAHYGNTDIVYQRYYPNS